MSPAEIGLGVVVAVMGGGNAWNWLASRGKQKVDLITLGQTISKEIIAALKAEREELTAKVGELEVRIGELAGHIETLEAVISKLGGKVPPRPVNHRKVAE